MPHFHALGHSIDAFTLMFDGHQGGLAWQVIIPQIMVDRLEMPHPFAGVRSQSQDAISEKILANSIPTKMIVGRRPGTGENHPALLVQSQPAPAIRSANGLPRVGRPCFVTELAW